MKVLGIIAEYNPFHNGHLYHLEKSVEITGADFVVAIISGNFVQRGEPAILDKWKRSEIAVKNGVDLVIELPFAYSCNNAEMFAKGSIEILNGLGCITHMSFGSEVGSIEILKEIANLLSNETEDFKNSLKKNLDKGLSFAASRQNAIIDILGNDYSKELKGSNNILAIEYLKYLNLTKSKIIPLTIPRKGPDYNEQIAHNDIASATFIRGLVDQGESIKKYIPEKSYDEIKKAESFVRHDDFYEIIRYKLMTMDMELLSKVYSVSEGLENKIGKSINKSESLNEFVESVISKRYTETRIKRILMHSLLGLYKENFNNIINKNSNYARILAFNSKGAELIKLIKKKEVSTIPLITNINKEVEDNSLVNDLLYFDILASNIYNLVSKNNIYINSDYVKIPFYEI